MRRARPRGFLLALAMQAAGALGSCDAHAEPDEAATPTKTPAEEEQERTETRERLLKLTEPGRYVDLFGTLMVGEGMRFNNPYRLSHELGKTGESLSTTAPYVDLAFGATLGNPDRWQHGLRLAWSLSLSGVPQQVVTPAYLAVLRLPRPWLVYGWAGLPMLLEPDFNVGGELGLGGVWWARAGLGVTGALIADGFYGAATHETRGAFYPVISGQLGLIINYEVLP